MFSKCERSGDKAVLAYFLVLLQQSPEGTEKTRKNPSQDCQCSGQDPNHAPLDIGFIVSVNFQDSKIVDLKPLFYFHLMFTGT
jgi:hypothetical protein